VRQREKEIEMRIVSIVLRVLLGLIFLAQGVTKVAGLQNAWRDDLEVAPWFWVLTGIIQAAGALGLFASLRYESLVIPSGLVFVVVMLGALATHIRIGDPVAEMIPPTVWLLVAAAIVVIGWQQVQRGGSTASSGPEITSSGEEFAQR
jgi:hypothetical protein